ncbi:MAG TPA: MBL fold metallo-hydrolase [Gemmatimonadaceae bacterium]
MKVHVLGSGSGGNAVVLESERERVLVDAGFSPRMLSARMKQLDVAPESISALIVTHEHGDHVRGARFAAARWKWPVYATPGTTEGYKFRRVPVAHLSPRREVVLDDFSFKVIRTPHDALEPVAFVATARSSGARVGIAYDLGHVTERFASHFLDVDILLLEANHDEDMLWAGPYPWIVKQRIAGLHGHLSNAAAGVMARACVHRGLRHIVLCHLSQTNNRPEVAISAVKAALHGSGYRGTLQAASQDQPLSVSLGRAWRPAQMALEL